MSTTCNCALFGCHELGIVEKGKALNFQNSSTSHSHLCHKSCSMTKWVRSQVRASEMRFLRRIKGVTLLNKERSSEIRKSRKHRTRQQIEKSQLRWLGYVSRIPLERLRK